MDDGCSHAEVAEAYEGADEAEDGVEEAVVFGAEVAYHEASEEIVDDCTSEKRYKR